jgi:hypothetical protein
LKRGWVMLLLIAVALAAPAGAWLSPTGSDARTLFRLLGVLVGLAFGSTFAFMRFRLWDVIKREDRQRVWEWRAVGMLAPLHDDEPDDVHRAKLSARRFVPLYLLALVAAAATWFSLR